MSSTAELTLVLKARNLANREVGKLSTGLDRVHGAAGRAGAGIKKLGKIAAVAAAGGLLAAVGVLGKAASMAADEEVGIERLNAALKANDKAHSASTKAIDKAITAREDLAFSDDDLRASLTILVTKTKDSQKALDLQTTAMDLARLKGISLADASKLLSKGMDGSKKALADLGIELPKTATKTERLAAIQKAAAGQAEKYAATGKAGFESFQIAMDDVMEELGTLLLPAMKGLAKWLREHGIPAFRALASRIGGVVTRIGNFVDSITKNKPVMNTLRDIGKAISDAFGAAGDAVGSMAGAYSDLATRVSKNERIMKILAVVMKSIADRITSAADAMRSLVGWATKAVDILSHLKLPNINLPGLPIPHAAGGWVGLHGPEVGLLGEKGPEYITSNKDLQRGARGPLGDGGGVRLVGISERDVMDMIDRGLYFRLQRAGASRVRV